MAGEESAASREGMLPFPSIHSQGLMRQQYERIDPDELQALKNKNERLKAAEVVLKERLPVTDNTEMVEQLKKQVCSTGSNRARRSPKYSPLAGFPIRMTVSPPFPRLLDGAVKGIGPGLPSGGVPGILAAELGS